MFLPLNQQPSFKKQKFNQSIYDILTPINKENCTLQTPDTNKCILNTPEAEKLLKDFNLSSVPQSSFLLSPLVLSPNFNSPTLSKLIDCFNDPKLNSGLPDSPISSYFSTNFTNLNSLNTLSSIPNDKPTTNGETNQTSSDNDDKLSIDTLGDDTLMIDSKADETTEEMNSDGDQKKSSADCETKLESQKGDQRTATSEHPNSTPAQSNTNEIAVVTKPANVQHSITNLMSTQPNQATGQLINHFNGLPSNQANYMFRNGYTINNQINHIYNNQLSVWSPFGRPTTSQAMIGNCPVNSVDKSRRSTSSVNSNDSQLSSSSKRDDNDGPNKIEDKKAKNR